MSTLALAAVFQHSTSRGAARLVLLAMADEANDEGLLTAYRRSQSHLGRKANVDARTVQRSIAQLVELGEVVVLQSGDGRASSDYRLVLPGLRTEGGQVAAPAPAPRRPRGGTTPPQGGQVAAPIIPLLPTDTPVTPTTSRGSERELAEAFEQFWQVYPRTEAKAAARKAWPAAVKAAGGAGPILAGAERYRDDPNREPRYTAHAATWLRAERWTDAPLPPRAQRGQAGGQQARPVDTDRNGPTGRLEL